MKIEIKNSGVESVFITNRQIFEDTTIIDSKKRFFSDITENDETILWERQDGSETLKLESSEGSFVLVSKDSSNN